MFLATVLALASASLHATWNLLVKTSGDRRVASVGQFLVGGLLGAAGLAVSGLPGTAALPWLAASSAVHLVYVAMLVRAYESGDFSLAYPLARGGGATVAAIGGVALLGDHLVAAAWLAIGVVVVGLLSLVTRTTSATSVGWALLTALTIGTYTVIDSHGSRLATSGAAYGLALMPMSGAVITGWAVMRGRGPALVGSLRSSWPRHLAAGACLTTAYTLVLVAVRHAPVGYVTMLRESSVAIGAVAAWLVLHEQLGRRRLASSAVVALGLVALVVVSP